MQSEPLMTMTEQQDQVPLLMKDTHVSEQAGNINSVPARISNDIMHEASNLTAEPGNIVPLPGTKDGKVYIAANTGKATDPFQVKYAPSSLAFSCEKKCSRFSGFKICQHCVAVSHRIGVLASFLKKFGQVKKYTAYLTNLSNTNMPANRGKKANRATQKRKGRQSKTASNFLLTDEDMAAADHTSETRTETGQPLHLTLLAGLIRKCYGCDQLFQDKYRKPPFDLILKRFDYRIYVSLNSKARKRSRTLQNTDFHLNGECVRRICPTFDMKDIILHEEIKGQLREDHRNVLRKAGIDFWIVKDRERCFDNCWSWLCNQF